MSLRRPAWPVTSSRMLPPHTVALQIDGPEMLTEAIRNAHFDARLLAARPGSSRIARVPFASTCLDLISLGSAFRFTGAMPADCYTLIFILTCPEVGHAFNFPASHTDGFLGLFAPGSDLDAFTPSGYANASLTVAVEDFHAAMALVCPEIPERAFAEGIALRVGAAAQARLRTLIAAVEREAWSPRSLVRDPWIYLDLERDLLHAFLDCVRSGIGEVVAAPGQCVARRHRKLRLVEEFIAANAQASIDIGQLCAVADLSHRGLENLFGDFLGMGPMAYLKRHRLHLARRVLIDHEPAIGIVKQVALAHGFWHLGHFAESYGDLFGEGPIQTASRPRRSKTRWPGWRTKASRTASARP